MLAWKRKHDFVVAIDSDGCAFDTMELKHKECFIPNIIQHYHLQGVSKYAREAAEFVNLYSKSRGVNRFPGLVETLDWLRRRPEVQARGQQISIPTGLVAWIARESKLGNPALQRAVEHTADPHLVQALAWSNAVNQSVAQMVHGVPPFPYVRESLEKLASHADMLVVSATPQEALIREWQEHGLDRYVAIICGQEAGTKKEILTLAAQYPTGHALMVGDAPGDDKAAQHNHALFFPIVPGHEERSWQRLHDEGIDRLLRGHFAGTYQDQLRAEFDRALPAQPPWPVSKALPVT